MRAMQVILSPGPDEDTAAAVLAAIACAIEQDAAGDVADTPARSSWRTAGVLAAYGLPGARNAANASWHAAERTRRAERWSGGVVGM
jgi:hypothetical protein